MAIDLLPDLPDITMDEGIDLLPNIVDFKPKKSKNNPFQFEYSDYESPGSAFVEGVSRIPGNIYGLGKSIGGALSDVPMEGGYADTSKAALQGLIGGAREGLNIPYNMVEYVREHQRRKGADAFQVPDWVQAWKPSEETTGLLNKAEQYWKPENENRFTDFVKGGAKQIPSAIAGGGPLVGMTLNAIGENRNIFEDPFAMKSLQYSPKIIKPVLKTTGKVAGKAASAVKSGIEDIGKGKYSQAKTVERGNKIVSDLEDYYKNGYDTITTDSRLPKIEWDIPDSVFNKFNRYNPNDAVIIEKALTSRDPTDVHHAASKTGNYIHKEQTSVAPNSTGLYYAIEVQKALEKGLDNSLRTVPELEFSYRNLDKQFAGDLGRVGRKVRGKLKKYRIDRVGTEGVMRAFRLPEGAEEFRHKFGSELPGIKSAKHPETWKNLPITGTGFNLVRKLFGDK